MLLGIVCQAQSLRRNSITDNRVTGLGSECKINNSPLELSDS